VSGFPAWDEGEARALLAGMGHGQDKVLPMLQALQARYGFVHAAAVGLVAAAVNVSRAEVHGVVTFYHDFRTAPPPARVIRLCRAEACQAVGCEALVAEAARLGVAVDGPPAGGVAVETVYCLGNCALGPAALVGEELVGLLDAGRLRALVAGA
jgi:formate dehydrogenase subunit gamma